MVENYGQDSKNMKHHKDSNITDIIWKNTNDNTYVTIYRTITQNYKWNPTNKDENYMWCVW